MPFAYETTKLIERERVEVHYKYSDEITIFTIFLDSIKICDLAVLNMPLDSTKYRTFEMLFSEIIFYNRLKNLELYAPDKGVALLDTLVLGKYLKNYILEFNRLTF